MSRTIKMLLVGALLLALTAGVATAQSAQATQDCGELEGEQRGRCNGSRGDDAIVESGLLEAIFTDNPDAGDGVDDNIFAKAGNDTVDASFFDDDVDKLYGGRGDDTLRTDDGDPDDFIDCGKGTDEATIDPGDDTKNCSASEVNEV